MVCSKVHQTFSVYDRFVFAIPVIRDKQNTDFNMKGFSPNLFFMSLLFSHLITWSYTFSLVQNHAHITWNQSSTLNKSVIKTVYDSLTVAVANLKAKTTTVYGHSAYKYNAFYIIFNCSLILYCKNLSLCSKGVRVPHAVTFAFWATRYYQNHLSMVWNLLASCDLSQWSALWRWPRWPSGSL